jgi:hypothetical protein
VRNAFSATITLVTGYSFTKELYTEYGNERSMAEVWRMAEDGVWDKSDGRSVLYPAHQIASIEVHQREVSDH